MSGVPKDAIVEDFGPVEGKKVLHPVANSKRGKIRVRRRILQLDVFYNQKKLKKALKPIFEGLFPHAWGKS